MVGNRVLGLMVGAGLAAFFASAAFAQSPYMKERAEKGDAQAQFEYAMQLNQAVASQREEARMWMQKAADAGIPGAIYWLGRNGWGKEGTDYSRKAADLGYPAAVRDLLGSLINAGAMTDVIAAKKYADIARAKDISLNEYQKAFLAVIDACYRAGPANMPSVHPPNTVSMEGYHRIEDVANGRGAPRDPKKALALFCRDDFMAPAEMEIIAPALEAAIATPPARAFDFCNYITSGEHTTLCAGELYARQDKQLESEFKAVSASWTPEQAAGLVALRKAAESYFDAHVYYEMDQSGSAHGAVSMGTMTELHTALLNSLKDFEVARFPARADFAKADRELNDAYRTLLARKEWDGSLQVSPSKPGVRDTERAWLVYRDAWVALGAARYPQVPADEWKAWLTRARTDDLAEIAKYLPYLMH